MKKNNGTLENILIEQRKGINITFYNLNGALELKSNHHKGLCLININKEEIKKLYKKEIENINESETYLFIKNSNLNNLFPLSKLNMNFDKNYKIPLYFIENKNIKLLKEKKTFFYNKLLLGKFLGFIINTKEKRNKKELEEFIKEYENYLGETPKIFIINDNNNYFSNNLKSYFLKELNRESIDNFLKITINEYNNESAALIDPLTKTFSFPALRRKDYINYILELSIEHQPKEIPFNIIMFDINNLKKVNDTYGHKKGDEYIKKFSTLLKKLFRRETDIICRNGGDEFLIITINSNPITIYNYLNNIENLFSQLMQKKSLDEKIIKDINEDLALNDMILKVGKNKDIILSFSYGISGFSKIKKENEYFLPEKIIKTYKKSKKEYLLLYKNELCKENLIDLLIELSDQSSYNKKKRMKRVLFKKDNFDYFRKLPELKRIFIDLKKEKEFNQRLKRSLYHYNKLVEYQKKNPFYSLQNGYEVKINGSLFKPINKKLNIF